MIVDFVKMEGIGNDYIYFDFINDETNIDLIINNVEKLSNRHFGIGSDGVVLILKSDLCDFKMRMFNVDGSEAKMCGNAIRCVAKYVYENEYTNKKTFSIETLSGVKIIDIETNNKMVTNVLVDMGKPEINPKLIPVISDKSQVINEAIYIDDEQYMATCVSMGNPHVVILVDDVDNINLEILGPKFENNKIFPERINTEFVQILNENTIKMRVWERGSGETLACGTGACASVVACVLNNIFKKDEKIDVILKGGNLQIMYSSNENVFMKGPAKFCFNGIIDI